MANQPVNQKSFVNLFPTIVDDDKIKLLDIWNSYRVRVVPAIYNADAYIEYNPASSDTLYGLANTYYGDPALWWVIPLVNDAEDPFDFIQDAIDNGTTILILKNTYISSILFTMSRLKNSKDNGQQTQ
jgi:hypothetical protein